MHIQGEKRDRRADNILAPIYLDFHRFHYTKITFIFFFPPHSRSSLPTPPTLPFSLSFSFLSTVNNFILFCSVFSFPNTHFLSLLYGERDGSIMCLQCRINVISWRSTLQTTVVSITEPEYMAIVDAIKEAIENLNLYF